MGPKWNLYVSLKHIKKTFPNILIVQFMSNTDNNNSVAVRDYLHVMQEEVTVL